MPRSQLIQFTGLLENSLFLIWLLFCQDSKCIGSVMEQHVLSWCGFRTAGEAVSCGSSGTVKPFTLAWRQ